MRRTTGTIARALRWSCHCGEAFVAEEEIISIGLLTRRDLAALGSGFTRHFPVPRDDAFADLLAQLDRVSIEPAEDGVILRREIPIE